jgi:hypothetical protein
MSPPSSDDSLWQALQLFLQAPTWNESRRVLNEHPELLSEMAVALLAEMLVRAQHEGRGQLSSPQDLSERIRLLERALELVPRANSSQLWGSPNG